MNTDNQKKITLKALFFLLGYTFLSFLSLAFSVFYIVGMGMSAGRIGANSDNELPIFVLVILFLGGLIGLFFFGISFLIRIFKNHNDERKLELQKRESKRLKWFAYTLSIFALSFTGVYLFLYLWFGCYLKDVFQGSMSLGIVGIIEIIFISVLLILNLLILMKGVDARRLKER